MILSAHRLIRTVSLACTLGVAALLGLIVSGAQAKVVDPPSLVNLNTCNVSALSQPFARWLDFAHYELAPGGDFERSTCEPYAATGTRGSSSLSLPAGSSAQSPLTCVDAAYPSIRFFIAGHGTVAVSVVDGSSVIPAGVAIAWLFWWPTLMMPTSAPVLGALSGGTAQVSLRFTGLSGSPRIDDVFIDPWGRG
jgi:hypothetical protein